MIADPPLAFGAVHESTAEVSPAVPSTPVGAPGVVAGVPEAEAEALLSPALLVATTVTLYAVPFVSPVISHVNVGEPVVEQVATTLPEADAEAVYPVIALPLVLVTAVQVAVNCAFPTVRVGRAGAFGVVNGVAADEATEYADAPSALRAVTLNV